MELTATLLSVYREFVSGFVSAAPRIVTGLVFLVLAYITIRILARGLSYSLGKVYSSELVVGLGVRTAKVFLWFGVALVFLNLLGLGELAAGLGTASGFVALGIAFALKEMIADTVAGVYLLRDPDFEEGDKVETAGESGEVIEVGLRKSRLKLENGDLAVLSNSEVEKKWTRKD